MKFQPAIKWSGSKRSQVDTILTYFPKEIDTYYEPFCGGANTLYALLHSDIKVNKYICSDLNKDLIDLWNAIKDNPTHLVTKYTKMWGELNKDDNGERRKAYYHMVRDRFNAERDPVDFLFINRTTTNGLIRYNQKGEFNNSFHFSRKGIVPNTLESILLTWHKAIIENDVQFLLSDYKHLTPKTDDFLYMDPPYFKTFNGGSGMYMKGTMDYQEFFEFLRNLPCGYLLSFDGKQGEVDNTYELDPNLYDKHIYIDSGVSSFKRIKEKEIINVQESLYIKYNKSQK